MERMYTGQEVADWLAISIYTVNRWRSDGVGPRYVAVQGVIRYPESAITEFLEQNTVRAGAAE